MKRFSFLVLLSALALFAGVAIFQYFVSGRSLEQKNRDEVRAAMNSNETLWAYLQKRGVPAVYPPGIGEGKDSVVRGRGNKLKLRYFTKVFFDFYQFNTRTRPDFCKANGVDITRFVRAFEARNKVEYERALLFAHELGHDPEDLYKEVAAGQLEYVEANTKKLVQMVDGTAKDSCQKLLSLSEHFADGLYVGTSHPGTYQALFAPLKAE